MAIIKSAAYFFLLGWSLSVQETDRFAGRWEIEDKTIVMEMYRDDGAYHGRVVSLNGKAPKEEEDRIILIQMQREKDVLFGGTFYSVKDRRESEAKIRLINDSLFVMKVFSGVFRQRCKWHKLRN